jgi:hypothetical protein
MKDLKGDRRVHRRRRGASLVPLVALLALVISAMLPPPVAGASSAQVARVTFDDDRDAETSVSVNPRNPSNVVAGWISRGDGTCGFGVSFDGGLSWPVVGVVPGIQTGSGGQFDRGTDPSVVFDRSGNAYYTCLAFNLFPPGTGSAGTIFVSKSTDGGVTWGAPVVALTGEDSPGNAVNEFEDHQFITANPANGHLYVTLTEFTAFGKPVILFTRSTDGGRTWAEPVQISDRAGNATFQDSFSAVGKDPRTIYVTFGAFANGGLPNWNRIYIAKSADGGLTFSQPQLLAEVAPLPDPLPNASWRSDNNLWVAVDRMTNQVYVNYADYNAGDADIRVMRVRDRGDRFEVQGITRVNDDGLGSDQFFPFITVVPGGRVDVCFQDRRYAPGNSLIFTTCAFSESGGSAFSNLQVTMVPFDASNNDFIGDYNWQASTDGKVLPIFVGDGVPGGDSDAQEVFVATVTP